MRKQPIRKGDVGLQYMCNCDSNISILSPGEIYQKCSPHVDMKLIIYRCTYLAPEKLKQEPYQQWHNFVLKTADNKDNVSSPGEGPATRIRYTRVRILSSMCWDTGYECSVSLIEMYWNYREAATPMSCLLIFFGLLSC